MGNFNKIEPSVNVQISFLQHECKNKSCKIYRGASIQTTSWAHFVTATGHRETHTANVTSQFLAPNNVNVLDWPANSSDLSPIEHIWDELGRWVRKDGNIHTINNQARELQRDWSTFIPAFI